MTIVNMKLLLNLIITGVIVSGLRHSSLRFGSPLRQRTSLRLGGLEEILNNPVDYYDAASALLVNTATQKLPEIAILTSETLNAAAAQLPDLANKASLAATDSLNAAATQLPTIVNGAAETIVNKVDVASQNVLTFVETSAQGASGSVAETLEKVNELGVSAAKTATNLIDASPKLLATASESATQSVKDIIEANPKLKLSASEFTADFVSNTIVPQIEGAVTSIEKSPLVQGFVSEFGDKSTSEYVTELSSNIAQKTVSFFNTAGNSLWTKASRPVYEWIASDPRLSMSASAYISDVLSGVFPADVASVGGGGGMGGSGGALAQGSGGSLPLPTIQLPSLDAETLDASFNQLKTGVESQLETSSIAVKRASSTFSEQLAEKGGVLTGNLASYTSATGRAINEIVDGIKSVDPKVVDKLVDDSVNDIKSATESLGAAFSKAGVTVTSKLSEKGAVVGNNLATVASATNNVIKNIGDFADEISKVDPQSIIDSKAIPLPSLSLPLPDQDTANAAVKGFFKSLQVNANDLIGKIQTWKLFADDHWETGLWEQQIKTVAEKTKEIDVEEIKRSIDKVAAQVDEILPKSIFFCVF